MREIMDETINGWRLTESSKESSLEGGNYENPFRGGVYVNVSVIDRTKDPVKYRAKFNDHGGPTHHIAVSEDLEEVYEAAVEWMEENPPTDGTGGDEVQQTLV